MINKILQTNPFLNKKENQHIKESMTTLWHIRNTVTEQNLSNNVSQTITLLSKLGQSSLSYKQLSRGKVKEKHLRYNFETYFYTPFQVLRYTPNRLLSSISKEHTLQDMINVLFGGDKEAIQTSRYFVLDTTNHSTKFKAPSVKDLIEIIDEVMATIIKIHESYNLTELYNSVKRVSVVSEYNIIEGIITNSKTLSEGQKIYLSEIIKKAYREVLNDAK